LQNIVEDIIKEPIVKQLNTNKPNASPSKSRLTILIEFYTNNKEE
jgi:hypothetical protein